jgi:hypothetical protein
MPLHVSSNKCSSSGGPTCINTPSGITHSGEWLTCRSRGKFPPDRHVRQRKVSSWPARQTDETFLLTGTSDRGKFPLDRHVRQRKLSSWPARQSLTGVYYTRWCINTSWSSWWWALAARNMYTNEINILRKSASSWSLIRNPFTIKTRTDENDIFCMNGPLHLHIRIKLASLGIIYPNCPFCAATFWNCSW